MLTISGLAGMLTISGRLLPGMLSDNRILPVGRSRITEMLSFFVCLLSTTDLICYRRLIGFLS